MSSSRGSYYSSHIKDPSWHSSDLYSDTERKKRKSSYDLSDWPDTRSRDPPYFIDIREREYYSPWRGSSERARYVRGRSRYRASWRGNFNRYEYSDTYYHRRPYGHLSPPFARYSTYEEKKRARLNNAAQFSDHDKQSIISNPHKEQKSTQQPLPIDVPSTSLSSSEGSVEEYESISSSTSRDDIKCRRLRQKHSKLSQRNKLQSKGKRSKITGRKVRLSPIRHVHLPTAKSKLAHRKDEEIITSDEEKSVIAEIKSSTQRTPIMNKEFTLRSNSLNIKKSLNVKTSNVFNSNSLSCTESNIQLSPELEQLPRQSRDKDSKNAIVSRQELKIEDMEKELKGFKNEYQELYQTNLKLQSQLDITNDELKSKERENAEILFQYNKSKFMKSHMEEILQRETQKLGKVEGINAIEELASENIPVQELKNKINLLESALERKTKDFDDLVLEKKELLDMHKNLELEYNNIKLELLEVNDKYECSMQTLGKENHRLKSSIANMEELLENRKLLNVNAETIISNKESEITALEKEISVLITSKDNNARKNIEILERKNINLGSDIEQYQKEIKDLTLKVNLSEQRLTEETNMNFAQIETFCSQIEYITGVKIIEKQQRKLQEVKNIIDELINEKIKLQADLENQKLIIKTLERENKQMKSDIEDYVSLLANRCEKLNDLQNDMNKSNDELNNLKAKLNHEYEISHANEIDMANIKNEINSWAQVLTQTEKLVQEEINSMINKDTVYQRNLQLLRDKMKSKCKKLKKEGEDMKSFTSSVLQTFKEIMLTNMNEVKSTSESIILSTEKKNIELKDQIKVKDKIINNEQSVAKLLKTMNRLYIIMQKRYNKIKLRSNKINVKPNGILNDTKYIKLIKDNESMHLQAKIQKDKIRNLEDQCCSFVSEKEKLGSDIVELKRSKNELLEQLNDVRLSKTKLVEQYKQAFVDIDKERSLLQKEIQVEKINLRIIQENYQNEHCNLKDEVLNLIKDAGKLEKAKFEEETKQILSDNHAETEKLHKKLKEYCAEVTKMKVEISNATKENESLNTKLLDWEQNYCKLDEEHQDTKKQFKFAQVEYENKSNGLLKDSEHLRLRNEALHQQNIILKDEIKEKNLVLNQIESNVQSLSKELNLLRNSYKAMNDEHEQVIAENMKKYLALKQLYGFFLTKTSQVSFSFLWEHIEKRTNQLIQNLTDKKEQILSLQDTENKTKNLDDSNYSNRLTFKILENQINIIVDQIGIASSTNTLLQTELLAAKEVIKDLKTSENILTVEERELRELEVQSLKSVNSQLENILRKRTTEYNDLKNMYVNDSRSQNGRNDQCELIVEEIKDFSLQSEGLIEPNQCKITETESSLYTRTSSNVETDDPGTQSEFCEPKSSSQEGDESSIGIPSEEEFLLPDI